MKLVTAAQMRELEQDAVAGGTSLDELMEQAGLAVAYSSGTSERHTVLPRDMKTFLSAEYAMAKIMTCILQENVTTRCWGELLWLSCAIGGSCYGSQRQNKKSR